MCEACDYDYEDDTVYTAPDPKIIRTLKALDAGDFDKLVSDKELLLNEVKHCYAYFIRSQTDPTHRLYAERIAKILGKVNEE